MNDLKYIPLQLEYQRDPWKMLVCCIFLNLTNRVQVRSIIYQFFDKYPDPERVIQSTQEELIEIIQPLGLSNKRSITLQRFSQDWLRWDGSDVRDLYGIGQYGWDSWEIFQKENYNIHPKDKVLQEYLQDLN